MKNHGRNNKAGKNGVEFFLSPLFCSSSHQQHILMVLRASEGPHGVVVSTLRFILFFMNLGRRNANHYLVPRTVFPIYIYSIPRGRGVARGGVLDIMHGHSRTTVDPRISTFLFFSSSGGLVKIKLKLTTLSRSCFVSCVNFTHISRGIYSSPPRIYFYNTGTEHVGVSTTIGRH